MSDLLGIIAPLKKFLSDTDEEITMLFGENKNTVLMLSKGRIYNIPDFQREIRWTCDNVSMLVEDINLGSKFLGNIILTKLPENKYSVIDGQQRLTILTMILNCIRSLHQDAIDLFVPCRLTIDSLAAFGELMEKNFSKEEAMRDDIIRTDHLKQVHKYCELWDYIIHLEVIRDKRQAKNFISNLGSSKLNIIINESDDVSEGIRYFIDVNLKGKQLDTEDIFKSYLFRNDSGKAVREKWYELKTNVAKIESSKMEYPLLKLLEHYFYCDLYLTDEYKGMEFGTDFLLKKSYKASDNRYTYREGTHIIEVINDNKYMLNALDDINSVIRIMLEIVNCASITDKLTDIFIYMDSSQKERRLDNVELKIIHNIIGKTLKDSKVPPKAVVMKYILLVLIRNKNKKKEDIRKVYGVYLFTVLFMIFENKKSTDILINVLRAKTDHWYDEMIKQINGYFSADRITDGRIVAQYKLGRNEEEENYRFRCKSLATIYNFFYIANGTVIIRKGMLDILYKFVNDESLFSLEHFVICDSKHRRMKVSDSLGDYEIDEKVYKKYVNSIFNFIFIEGELNSELLNYWLPEKIARLNIDAVNCEYSKMVIEKLRPLSKGFEECIKGDFKDDLDLFFARDFKDKYIEYAKEVLETIFARVKESI